MALSIKDEDTDRLVRRYAKLKKMSFTRAIHAAVTDALRKEGALAESGGFTEAVRRIQDRVAAMPRISDLSPDEILGYDENGLPS